MDEKIQYKNPVTQLGWAKIDHVLTFDPTLSDGAFRTYAMLVYHAQQDGETYTSLDTIANERDLRRETISAHVKELEEHGLISRRPRVGTSTITELEELPKVYQDMAAVVLNARQTKKETWLDVPHREENLTSPLEKPNDGRAKNLTRQRMEEPDDKKATPNIFSLYENLGLLLNPIIREELIEAEKDYPPLWIKESFRRAASANIRRWSYIKRILENWQARGGMDEPRGASPPAHIPPPAPRVDSRLRVRTD